MDDKAAWRAVTALVLAMQDNGVKPEAIITGLIANAGLYSERTGTKTFAISLLREALERLEGTADSGPH